MRLENSFGKGSRAGWIAVFCFYLVGPPAGGRKGIDFRTKHI